MNYNGYPQNMNVILMMSEQGELIKKYNKKIKHDIDFTKMGV